jgi:hypothetical protein
VTDEEPDGLSDEDVVAQFRRTVDQGGAVRIPAGTLVGSFGYMDLTKEARESVSEHLWEAGLLTQPTLEGDAVGPESVLKVVDRGQVAKSVDPDGVAVRYVINPAGVALACIGGLAMAVAAFLPLDESGRFARVQENALIHHGGWAFLALGAGIAVNAYRQYSAGRLAWTVVVLGVIALIVAILIGSDTSLRTLFPLNSAGEPDSSQPGTVVPLGLAVYVAGAGACAAILGGWAMRQSPSGEAKLAPQTLKQCPDCAETIQAAAKVCKHCGKRFDAAPEVA